MVSLKYGKLLKKNRYILLALFIFSLTLLVAVVIASIKTNSLAMFIVGSLFSLFGTILFSFYIIKDIILAFRFKEWTKDAVKLYARVKTTQTYENALFMPKKYKAKVIFEYNNKKIDRNSGTKSTNGYFFFRQFDETWLIFYSPKYDEVILITKKEA